MLLFNPWLYGICFGYCLTRTVLTTVAVAATLQVAVFAAAARVVADAVLVVGIPQTRFCAAMLPVFLVAHCCYRISCCCCLCSATGAHGVVVAFVDAAHSADPKERADHSSRSLQSKAGATTAVTVIVATATSATPTTNQPVRFVT